MSQTIIPQSSKQKHPGANEKFVGSRSGGPTEQSRTKLASNKHQNPEYFKRQTDRGNENVGRGVGQIGAADKMKKDNIPARKDVPIQRNFNHIKANVGNDPGRGTGQVGRDSKKKR